MSIPYRKIMIALDGSALANQALPHAQMLAAGMGAELILFRAVEEFHPTVVMLGSTEVALEDPEFKKQPALLKQADKELHKVIELAELHEPKPQVAVEIGHPAEAIVDFAKTNNVDLIVMSTHGRTGLARLVYGSVAEKVLHTASCPVLLIRAKIE